MGLQLLSLHPSLEALGFHEGQLSLNPALLSHQGKDTPRYKTPPSPCCKSRLGLYYSKSRELSPYLSKCGKSTAALPTLGCREVFAQKVTEPGQCLQRAAASITSPCPAPLQELPNAAQRSRGETPKTSGTEAEGSQAQP